ncbi:MAG: hypothetical protein HUJ91_05800 [Bacteroidales bacterium]|nr:hypothetical protein [Bacteroidales bacterium]
MNRYAACLDFLAFRYSRSDGRYGRIDKWILHNEVDMGTSWTNMGAQHLNTYMHEYVKSLRICHDIARSYNPNAEVMASFTHNWMQRDDYCAKEMLDILLDYSRTEGDFHWGVALHPYPQSLSNPKTWNDSGATWSMNTKYITFKNLEVIDHWIKQPEHKFRNSEKRSLWLSENGANSPSYSDSDLANQAACAAWALYKVSQLDGIDAMQWHNWSDNPEEGVKIGLRTQDLDPKPAYYVYKAAYTSSQESVFAPYLPVIGVSSWPQIMRTVE